VRAKVGCVSACVAGQVGCLRHCAKVGCVSACVAGQVGCLRHCAKVGCVSACVWGQVGCLGMQLAHVIERGCAPGGSCHGTAAGHGGHGLCGGWRLSGYVPMGSSSAHAWVPALPMRSSSAHAWVPALPMRSRSAQEPCSHLIATVLCAAQHSHRRAQDLLHCRLLFRRAHVRCAGAASPLHMDEMQANPDLQV